MKKLRKTLEKIYDIVFGTVIAVASLILCIKYMLTRNIDYILLLILIWEIAIWDAIVSLKKTQTH